MTQTETRDTVCAAPRGTAGGPGRFPCRVGKWELTALAGQGGWSRIFRARPVQSPPSRPAAYAMKMVLPGLGNHAEAVRRLAREAQVGRSVSHPHLVAILDSQVGRSPQFLVMPWLEGATLQTLLDAGPPGDLPAALWIVRQVAEAIAALDAEGWRHGDIKPSNIFVSPEGHVTLLDLGFAQRRDEVDPADRTIAGTACYLAPEYFTATLPTDVRSDIYSLGVVLYNMLAGCPPLAGESLGELAIEHKQTAPVYLRRLAPRVTTGMAELVQRMLAKDPLRRPQTPKALVDELAWLEIATFSERAA
jgi:eukaryotic-like serine/threonine-protein kinase